MKKLIFFTIFIFQLVNLPICQLAFAAGETKPFENSYFETINGVNLHYRIWDVSQDKAKGKIFLVHGFCGSTFSWRNNVAALQKAGYEIVAVDLPAYGYSSRKRNLDHSQTARAKLLWKLIDKIDARQNMPGGRWNIAGHSMGGGVIAAMDNERPDSVSKLIFVDAAVYEKTSDAQRFFTGIWPVRFFVELSARGKFTNEKEFKKILSGAYGEMPDSESLKGYMAPLGAKGTEQAIIDSIVNSQARNQFDLKKIASPSLLIFGQNDSWIKKDTAKKMKAELKDSYLETISDAVHCPMETQPQVFNVIVVNFLNR